MKTAEAKAQLLVDIADAGLTVASTSRYEAQFDDDVTAHGGDVDSAYATCSARIRSAAAKLKRAS